jgi:hypothetical protein
MMLLSNSYALPANYLIFLALKILILGAESIHQILCSFPARCTWLSTASCLHRLWLYVIGFQIWLDDDILFCLIFSAITMNYVTFKSGCIYKNVSLLRWLCRLHARIPKFSGSCLNIVFFFADPHYPLPPAWSANQQLKAVTVPFLHLLPAMPHISSTSYLCKALATTQNACVQCSIW